MPKYRITKHDNKTYAGQQPWSTYKALKGGLQFYYRKPFFSFDSELGLKLKAALFDIDVYMAAARLNGDMLSVRYQLIIRLEKFNA